MGFLNEVLGSLLSVVSVSGMAKLIGLNELPENKDQNANMSTGTSSEIIERELDESLGEIICPECEGRGTIWNGHIQTATTYCTKCWGKGKLDWIEQAVGVKPPDYGSSGAWGTSGSSGAMGTSGAVGTSGTSGPDGDMFSFNDSLLDKFADEMAQNLANEIDDEILSEIMKEYDDVFLEQNSVTNSFIKEDSA